MTTNGDQTRVLLFAPLVFFPFLALLFWAAGGGKAVAQERYTTADARINANLPGAAFSGKEEDKLSLYDQADKDSAKLRELRAVEARDWHVRGGQDSASPAQGRSDLHLSPGLDADQSPEAGGVTTPDALERRLSQLQAQLAAAKNAPAPPVYTPPAAAQLLNNDTAAAHLQQTLNALSAPGGADPEISQLNTLLDKVIAIQHPEAADTVKTKSGRDSVHRVNMAAAGVLAAGGSFFGFTETAIDTIPKNTIAAEVYQDQTISPGSNVTLMLLEDMRVAGYRIPKGNFLTGHCQITLGRVHISISGVIVGSTILTVNLSVFDLDGEEGINAPNSLLREQSREGGAGMINDVGMSSLDPSLAAQATSAGLQTARSFLSKRIKVIKVPLYAGYRVLLKNS